MGSVAAPHRGHLAEIFSEAGRGVLPPPDGAVAVVPPPSVRTSAVVAFTGHVVVAAPLEPGEVRAHLPAGDIGAPMRPEFLQWLAGRLDAPAGTHDVVLVGAGTGIGADGLERLDDDDHPRVVRARRFRDDVEVYRHPAGGILVLGRGVAGRRELAFEVEPGARDKGLGRNLVAAATALTPAREPVWAQVAPGNAASLRTVLAGGFVPIGAEVLFLTGA